MEPVEKFDELKKQNKRARKGRFEPYEVSFIKANWSKMTDKEIAEELSRTEQAISIQRKKFSLQKNKIGGRPPKVRTSAIDMKSSEYEIVREEYKSLTREQKKKLFEQRFKHTKRYDQLIEVLEEEEMDFYCERWLDYVNTWETLLVTEEDTLHLAIMELIRAHRIMRRQRHAMDDEANQTPMDFYDRQYKECVDTHKELMKTLSGTRAQRLSIEKEDKFNLTTIVQALQDQEKRKKAGQEAAIIQKAKEFTAQNMRCKNYLID